MRDRAAFCVAFFGWVSSDALAREGRGEIQERGEECRGRRGEGVGERRGEGERERRGEGGGERREGEIKEKREDICETRRKNKRDKGRLMRGERRGKLEVGDRRLARKRREETISQREWGERIAKIAE